MRPVRYVLVRSSEMIPPAHARSNRKQSLADCLGLSQTRIALSRQGQSAVPTDVGE